MFEEQRKLLQSFGQNKKTYRESHLPDPSFAPLGPPPKMVSISRPESADFTKSWEQMDTGEKAKAGWEAFSSGDFINDWQRYLTGGVKNIGEKSGQILTSPLRVGRLITDKLGIKRDETSDDIIGQLSKIGQVGVEAAVRQVPGVSLVGGQELQASKEKTDSFGLKLADAVGSLGGALPTIGVLTNAGMKAITFSGALKWASKYPRLYSSLANGLAQSGAMSVTGQINMPLETEFKDRMKSFVHDASFGGVFGASGGLFKSFWAAVPAGGVINATQAYLDGGDTQDITIAALIGSAMEGVFRTGSIRNPEVAARNMAVDVFQKNGASIEQNSSVSDIAKAYQDIAPKLSDTQRNTLGRAYQILTNTKPELTAQDASDMRASIDKAAEIVKGTREGNTFTGDPVLSREIKRIQPEDISTQQDLLDRMREMKVNQDTIKQVADAFNINDTPVRPSKYDDISVDNMKQMVMEKSFLKRRESSLQSLPPVKDGFVRLYHVGNDKIGTGQWVDTIESVHKNTRYQPGEAFAVADVPESKMRDFAENPVGQDKADNGEMVIKSDIPDEYIVSKIGRLQSEVMNTGWEDFVKSEPNIARVKDDPEVQRYLAAIAKEKTTSDKLLSEDYAQTEQGASRTGAGDDRAPVENQVTRQQGADQESGAAPAQARAEGAARVQRGPETQKTKQESDRIFGINVKKYGFEPEQELKFRQSIEALAEQMAKNKSGTLSNKDITAAMESVGIERRIKTKEQTATELAALKNAQARIKELELQQERLAKDGEELSSADKDELVDLKYVVASRATSFGRDLQAMKMLVEKKPLFDRIIAEAAKKGIDIDVVKANMKKYDLNDTNGFIKFYRDTFGWTWKEAIDEYVYGNLLSSPRSMLRNAWYGVLHPLVVRPAGLLFDSPTSIPAWYKGFFTSFRAGKNAFAESWKQENINLKGDIYEHGARVPVSTMSKYWTVGPRIMEASDRFFFELIRGAEMKRLQSGKKATEAEIIAESERVAENLLGRTSFSLENKKYQGYIGDVLDGTGRLLNDPHNPASVGAKTVVRFVRTVMNISKHQVHNSPFGFLEMRGRLARKEIFGKAMAGTMVTILAAMKASDDETTFFAPTNEKDKEVFYASGRKPFSIKIGNKWVPFMYFGPWAFALAIPAAWHYYEKQNKGTYAGTRGEKLSATMGGIMSVLFQTTPIGPLSDLMEALAGNQTGVAPKLAANIGSQFIPFVSLLAYLADSFDPVARQAKDAEDTILRKLPLLKEQLTPYLELDKTPVKYDWTHYVLPYDIGTVEKDGDKLWNRMWLESLKGAFSDRQLKDLKEEMEKDSLREKGYMK